MPHPVTESISRRKAGMAARLRELKHLQVKYYPEDLEALETAARLLEQTSVNRFKKAVHSLRADEGKWLRRPAAGQVAPGPES